MIFRYFLRTKTWYRQPATTLSLSLCFLFIVLALQEHVVSKRTGSMCGKSTGPGCGQLLRLCCSVCIFLQSNSVLCDITTIAVQQATASGCGSIFRLYIEVWLAKAFEIQIS